MITSHQMMSLAVSLGIPELCRKAELGGLGSEVLWQNCDDSPKRYMYACA